MVTKSITAEAANLVNNAREDAGKSKLALATETGIPYTTLARKLDGHADFTLPELAAVANVLGVAPSRFVPALFRAPRAKAA